MWEKNSFDKNGNLIKYAVKKTSKSQSEQAGLGSIQITLCLFFIVCTLFIKVLNNDAFLEMKDKIELALNSGFSATRTKEALRFTEKAENALGIFAGLFDYFKTTENVEKENGKTSQIATPQVKAKDALVVTSDAQTGEETEEQEPIEEPQNEADGKAELVSEMQGQGGNVVSFENNEINKDVYNIGYPLVVPVAGQLTSKFESRINPITKRAEFHTGIDIGASLDSEIYAVAKGIVTTSDFNKISGNYVVIEHKNSLISSYGHMSRYIVKNGQQVKAGQVIGYVGSTGQSTGAHLHLELSLNTQKVDPLKAFKEGSFE